MVIKKFQAKTEEEAILLAKNELGKNATVMNIKTVKPKGIQKMFRKPSVEITAAVDEEQDYSNGEEMLSKMQEIQRNIQEAQRLEAEKQKEDVSQEDNAMTIENKLDNLQQMLEKQMFTEEKEEEQKQKNSRWEKGPENVEMKLWAVGKDQVETGSLKDLLDGSDEELEEWKD